MSPLRLFISGLGAFLLLAGALVATTGLSGLQPAPLIVAGGGLTLFGLRWLNS